MLIKKSINVISKSKQTCHSINTLDTNYMLIPNINISQQNNKINEFG